MGWWIQMVYYGYWCWCVEEQLDYEVVIVFDLKGDVDLFKCMYVECECVGCLDEFYVFYFGYFDLLVCYNVVGWFGWIFEVVICVVGQFFGEGNSVVFCEFVWWFVNIIVCVLYVLGICLDYQQIFCYVVNIDVLFVEYVQKYISEYDFRVWDIIIYIEGKFNDKNVLFNMKGWFFCVVVIDQYLIQKCIVDLVMEGLKSVVCYDKIYFDKIVVLLLLLLEKFIIGWILELFLFNYVDFNDLWLIFDWMQVICKCVVVYVGFDVLLDIEVVVVVGNFMFSDLVLVVGYIYKYGVDDGLFGLFVGGKVCINLYVDEFNELIGDEFIFMVNKVGGVGVQVMVYIQIMSDIEVKIGFCVKVGQIIGNFNNLFMLWVCEIVMVEFLINQFFKVQIYISMLVSGVNDVINNKKVVFIFSLYDQVQMISVLMFELVYIVGLFKGQVFVLFEGGNFWKI